MSDLDGFARQQWRAWIETPSSSASAPAIAGFARQQWRAWIETRHLRALSRAKAWIRPPAMAGVD